MFQKRILTAIYGPTLYMMDEETDLRDENEKVNEKGTNIY